MFFVGWLGTPITETSVSHLSEFKSAVPEGFAGTGQQIIVFYPKNLDGHLWGTDEDTQGWSWYIKS